VKVVMVAHSVRSSRIYSHTHTYITFYVMYHTHTHKHFWQIQVMTVYCPVALRSKMKKIKNKIILYVRTFTKLYYRLPRRSGEFPTRSCTVYLRSILPSDLCRKYVRQRLEKMSAYFNQSRVASCSGSDKKQLAAARTVYCIINVLCARTV